MTILATKPLQQLFRITDRVQRFTAGHGNVPTDQQMTSTAVVLQLDDSLAKQVANATDRGNLCSVDFNIAVSKRVALDAVNPSRLIGIDIHDRVAVRTAFFQGPALRRSAIDGARLGTTFDFLAIVLATECPVVETSFGKRISIGTSVANRDGVLVGRFDSVTWHMQDTTTVGAAADYHANRSTGTFNGHCDRAVLWKQRYVGWQRHRVGPLLRIIGDTGSPKYRRVLGMQFVEVIQQQRHAMWARRLAG